MRLRRRHLAFRPPARAGAARGLRSPVQALDPGISAHRAPGVHLHGPQGPPDPPPDGGDQGSAGERPQRRQRGRLRPGGPAAGGRGAGTRQLPRKRPAPADQGPRQDEPSARTRPHAPQQRVCGLEGRSPRPLGAGLACRHEPDPRHDHTLARQRHGRALPRPGADADAGAHRRSGSGHRKLRLQALLDAGVPLHGRGRPLHGPVRPQARHGGHRRGKAPRRQGRGRPHCQGSVEPARRGLRRGSQAGVRGGPPALHPDGHPEGGLGQVRHGRLHGAGCLPVALRGQVRLLPQNRLPLPAPRAVCRSPAGAGCGRCLARHGGNGQACGYIAQERLLEHLQGQGPPRHHPHGRAGEEPLRARRQDLRPHLPALHLAVPAPAPLRKDAHRRGLRRLAVARPGPGGHRGRLGGLQGQGPQGQGEGSAARGQGRSRPGRRGQGSGAQDRAPQALHRGHPGRCHGEHPALPQGREPGREEHTHQDRGPGHRRHPGFDHPDPLQQAVHRAPGQGHHFDAHRPGACPALPQVHQGSAHDGGHGALPFRDPGRAHSLQGVRGRLCSQAAGPARRNFRRFPCRGPGLCRASPVGAAGIGPAPGNGCQDRPPFSRDILSARL